MSIPRGIANKNPLNMEKTPANAQRWKGEVDSTDVRFAQFDTIEDGYRAAFKNIFQAYAKVGRNTIRKIISAWAPSKPVTADGKSENNTIGYIQRVSHDSGIDPDFVIDKTNETAMIAIISAMSVVENGIPAVADQVLDGFNSAKPF